MHAVKTYGGAQIQLQKFLALVLMHMNRQLQATHTHTHTHTHEPLLTTTQKALKSVWVAQRRQKSLAPARR